RRDRAGSAKAAARSRVVNTVKALPHAKTAHAPVPAQKSTRDVNPEEVIPMNDEDFKEF
ncbi:MAG: hypothetical protein IMF07_02250, partial [Proteobacteria bacterium]|nr:hypothetical protein [Pseudomonadota bacterium]